MDDFGELLSIADGSILLDIFALSSKGYHPNCWKNSQIPMAMKENSRKRKNQGLRKVSKKLCWKERIIEFCFPAMKVKKKLEELEITLEGAKG